MQKLEIETQRCPLGHDGILPGPRIHTVGYIRNKHFSIDHRFNDYGLVYVAEGRGTLRIDQGVVQIVSTGSLFFYHPGPQYRYAPDHGIVWNEYYLSANVEGIERWTSCGLLPRDRIVHPIGHEATVVSAFCEMQNVMRGMAPGRVDRVVNLAEKLLIEIYHLRNAEALQNDNAPIDAILGYCEEHLTEEIDFEKLAQNFTMSYSHLRRCVRLRTGVPPARYLAQRRCERACRLLCESALEIRDVGAKVGIPNPVVFSRVFLRHVGMTAREYRQKYALWPRH